MPDALVSGGQSVEDLLRQIRELKKQRNHWKNVATSRFVTIKQYARENQKLLKEILRWRALAERREVRRAHRRALKAASNV